MVKVTVLHGDLSHVTWEVTDEQLNEFFNSLVGHYAHHKWWRHGRTLTFWG